MRRWPGVRPRWRCPFPEISIVEDVTTLAETYVAYLSSEPVIATAVQTGHEALAKLQDCPPDVVALDINLPDMNGIDLLREIKSRGLPTEVIMVTAQGSLNLAVEAMREGAFDFIVKPLTRDRLRVTLRNALERRNLTNTVEALKEEFGRDHFCAYRPFAYDAISIPDYSKRGALVGNRFHYWGERHWKGSFAPQRSTVFLSGRTSRSLRSIVRRCRGTCWRVSCLVM